MFFTETTLGTFCFNKQFCLKNHVAKGTVNEVDDFCWQLRDGIYEIVDYSFNLSTKEKRSLHKLTVEKNKVHIINDTDKTLGPANADKFDVIMECKRQLFDVVTQLFEIFQEGG